jgi:hypothetical protein
MISPLHAQALRPLFESYAAGFDDMDPDALADLFAYPAVIWQGDKGHVFADEEEMGENIDAVLDLLDEQGVVQSHFELLNAALSEASGFASVSWRQEAEDGAEVFAFDCHYHLVKVAEEWRIAMIVNEV